MAARSYRGDIDGLRAISVLAVLLFHADLGVAGGFVGVDVFFVISGFLITKLIIGELARGQFSMACFWERRLRRIWPASLAVTAAVLAAGYWLMLPDDYRTLGGDAIAQLAMAANVRYWHGTDYFATSSDLRPLLHTWSLAVEEQFYVLYPLLLWIVWRYARDRVTAALVTLMLISLATSVLAVAIWPDSAFYLLPFRAWELLIGGILALLPTSSQLLGRHADKLALLGLSVIVAACFWYDRSTPFPGLTAIPVCVGTALVIAGAGQPSSRVGRVLGLGPIRAVGLMSYSLYLWHWPVFAFARYVYGIELSAAISAVGVIVSLAIAALSFIFVETPLRRGLSQWRFGQVCTATVVASGVLLAAAFGIWQSGGVPRRLAPELASFASVSGPRDIWISPYSEEMEIFVPIGSDCRADACPCFFYLGDSHAIALAPLVSELATERSLSGYASLRPGFCPFPGTWRPQSRSSSHSRDASVRFTGQILSRIATCKPMHVVVGARWSAYLGDGVMDGGDPAGIARLETGKLSPEESGTALRVGIRALVDACAQWGGHVWILQEVPYQPITPSRRVLDVIMGGGNISLEGVSREDHEKFTRRVRAVLSSIDTPRLHVVDLSQPFFEETGFSVVGRPGVSWYFDDDHVSLQGAEEKLRDLLESVFARIQQECSAPEAVR